jgi:hypothetical protein
LREAGLCENNKGVPGKFQCNFAKLNVSDADKTVSHGAGVVKYPLRDPIFAKLINKHKKYIAAVTVPVPVIGMTWRY